MNLTQPISVTQAITSRRSIKHYDTTHKLSESEIAKLMALAMLSPTAFNMQHRVGY